MFCYITKVWKDRFFYSFFFFSKVNRGRGASVPRTVKTRYCRSEKEGWTEPARQGPIPSIALPLDKFIDCYFGPKKSCVSAIYLKDISLDMWKFPLLQGRASCDFPKATEWRYKHSIFLPFKAFRLSLGICLLLFISMKDSKPSCISLFISVWNIFPWQVVFGPNGKQM